MNIDDRLRAAGKALKDGSVTQVDAASRLREVVRVAHDPAAGLPDRTPQPMERAALSPDPPANRLRLTPQRLALAVNLLLVLALGVLLILGVRYGQEPATTGTPPASSTVVIQTKVRVPPACIEVSRRGDELIHLFTTNERGRRLAAALKAYTKVSQQCRRSASP